jgi:hypothetical protein
MSTQSFADMQPIVPLFGVGAPTDFRYLTA